MGSGFFIFIRLTKLNANLSERIFFGVGTALQVKNDTTWYRLQIDPDGSSRVYKSIDSGVTWPNSEKIITNSDLTVSTGTVITTSYVTDGVFELRKTGNIVLFSSRTGITLAGLSAAGQAIFTLPVNFRPIQPIRVPCVIVTNSEFVARELAINSSGTCDLQGNGVQSATRVAFCVTFVTA